MGESGGRMIKRKKKAMCVHVLVMSDSFVTPWTVACWILCPWDFPGKTTRLACHFLLQGVFLPPGIKPQSLASLALAGRFFTTVPPGKQDEKRLCSATSWWWQRFVGLPE